MDYKALYEQQLEENKKLEAKADLWEKEHNTLWLSVSGALNDGGYGATSTGQIIRFIRDIINENKKLKEENEKWEADDANLTKIIYMINELHVDFSVSGVDDIYQCIKELKEQIEDGWAELRETEENFEEEIKKLKDFTNWENHPALKHKVVVDEDWYLQHLNEEGQLIHPDEVNELKEEVEELKEKITCLESDSYNEVSQAEYDDMKEDLESQIQELKSELDYDPEESEIVSKNFIKKLEEQIKNLKEQL